MFAEETGDIKKTIFNKIYNTAFQFLPKNVLYMHININIYR